MRWLYITILSSNIGCISSICDHEHTKTAIDNKQNIQFSVNQIGVYRSNLNAFHKRNDANINFNASLKDFYISATTNTPLQSIATGLEQKTQWKNDSYDVGYWPNYNGSVLDDEIYNNPRIAKWDNRLLPYLSINDDNPNGSFGYEIPNLYLKNELVWRRNQCIGNVNGTITYVNKDNVITDFTDPKQINYKLGQYGANNDDVDIYGIPYARLRILNGTYYLYKHDDENIYFIGNYNSPTNNNLRLLTTSDDNFIVSKKISYENLIAINSAVNDYNEKSFTIGLNNKFISQIQKMNDDTEEIFVKVKQELSKNSKYNDDKKLETLVKMNLLDMNNINSFITYLNTLPSFQFKKCVNWLKTSSTLLQDEAIANGWGKYDNPYSIWASVKDKTNYYLKFAINNTNKVDGWQSQIINNLSYDDLEKGIKIYLTPNRNNKYMLRFEEFGNNETNNFDCFVQKTSTKNLNISTANAIRCGDNLFELDSQKIVDSKFKENNQNWNSKFIPSVLTDDELVDAYVLLITNYNTIGDFSMLNKNNLKIMRDDINGLVDISICINGVSNSQTFTGFKKIPLKITNIEIDNQNQKISIESLTDQVLRDILIDNGYDRYLINLLSFTINNLNYESGKCIVTVNDCSRADLANYYINKQFEISNLEPFFIKQKTNIDGTILSMKPSEITKDIFFNSMVDMSSAFKNDKMNNTNVWFSCNDKTKELKVTFSYFQNNTNKYETHEFNYVLSANKKIQWYVWLLIGLIVISVIGLIVWCLLPKNLVKIKAKFKKQKLDNSN